MLPRPRYRPRKLEDLKWPCRSPPTGPRCWVDMGGRWVRPSHPVGGIPDRRPPNRCRRVPQTNQTSLIQRCSRSRGAYGPRRRGGTRDLATCEIEDDPGPCASDNGNIIDTGGPPGGSQNREREKGKMREKGEGRQAGTATREVCQTVSAVSIVMYFNAPAGC